MKKALLYIAAATVLFAGCAKEVDQKVEEKTGKVYTITAEVENNETRTYTYYDETVNKYHFEWVVGEEIAVLPAQLVAKPLPFTYEASDTFTYTASSEEPEYTSFNLAVTPYDAIIPGSTFDNYSLVLSGKYDQSESNAVMVAGTPTETDGHYKFTFKHAAALVHISYNEIPENTDSLVFSTPGIAIKGDWAFDDETETPIIVAYADQTNEYSTVKVCYDPEASITDFYIPIPTGNYQTFIVKLVDANGNVIPGSEKTFSTTSPFTVERADVIVCPEIEIEDVTITKGREYTLPISSTNKFSAYGTPLVYEGVNWVANKLVDSEVGEPGNYSPNKGGQQFGTSTNTLTGLKITCDNYASYCVSAGAIGINTIQVTSSSNNDVVITQSVKVGGVSMTADNPSYEVHGNTSYTSTFTSEELLTGTIEITYTNSTGNAIYVGDIVINPDARTNPNLAFDPTEYHIAANSVFTAPTPSAVDGFDGTLTYSTSDASIAAVNATTGEITIGATAGSAVITAAFEGNDTYKPSKTSYTIVVEAQAALTVSELSTSQVDYLDGSFVSFTVSSNLEWTASKNNDEVSNAAIKSVVVNGNTVTVTFNANSGDIRTAKVNVVPDDSNFSSLAQTVNIQQAAYESVVVYEKYSGALTEGDYLIVYDNGAMKASVTKDRLDYLLVSPENDKIKNPAASIIWHIAQDATYWTIYNDDQSKYAASTGADNKAKLETSVTDNSRWTVSGDATYEFVNKVNTGNKNLRRNGDYGFACYATGTGGALTLYKLADYREDSGISWSASTGTITLSTGNDQVDVSSSIPSLTNPHVLQVTYSSTNPDVATVGTDGSISWVGAGTTDISAKFGGDGSYRPITVSYQLTVTDNRLQCAKPSFDPDGGTYADAQTVTITTTTNGATIHYTTDDTDPTRESATFDGSINVDATMTIKAIAVKNGYKDSEVASAKYTVAGDEPQTSTLNFTAACGGSGTADDGAEWTVTSDAEESQFDSTCGVHYGTNSKSVTYVQLSTSDISGTVTQVVVNTRDAQAIATVSVTVGGTAFTCSGSATATNSSADYTFTGSGTGEIVVRVDRGSAKTKAIYVKSVVVSYRGI